MTGGDPKQGNAQTNDLLLSDGRVYYLCQLGGWGLYAILQYLLSPAPRGLATVVGAAVWCGIGMLGTHLLRTYTKRRRWQTIQQLALPFALAALLIPAAMNAVPIAVNAVAFPEKAVTGHGWVVLAHFVQAVLVVSVWCALYLSANEVRRRRLAEMEALRLALVAQVSQFHALRSQLNPHFLFNCLNSLRELIDEDQDRAKQVVDLLSELLRYTLRADRVDTVSLAEELRAVEDYLSLEKVRFEERLRLHFDIAQDSLTTKVPPMLLQTLAENGVKHGVAKLPAGGDLAIATYLAQGKLRIDVTNTGSLSAATSGSSAVGLENARERLRLMYGEGASLRLVAANDTQVRAEVAIPIHRNDVGS